MSDLKDELELAHKEMCWGLPETAKMHVIAALAIVTANESIEKAIETRPPLKERLVEATGTLHQALLEVAHAQRSGPGWYTKGESGLYQQVDMWVSKGFKAIEAITRELESGND